MFRVWMKSVAAAALTAGLVVALGCGQQAAPTSATASKEKKEEAASGHGWWCEEHGVLEDECSMCSDKLYKEAKAKDKLCPNHPDRAKDQCFICNPDLWAKSAARYKEKYGKEPPLPKDNMPGKK
ncbi:MAG TPA: hypothetical protein VGE74_10585 [Gemmata sp.]